MCTLWRESDVQQGLRQWLKNRNAKGQRKNHSGDKNNIEDEDIDQILSLIELCTREEAQATYIKNGKNVDETIKVLKAKSQESGNVKLDEEKLEELDEEKFDKDPLKDTGEPKLGKGLEENKSKPRFSINELPEIENTERLIAIKSEKTLTDEIFCYILLGPNNDILDPIHIMSGIELLNLLLDVPFILVWIILILSGYRSGRAITVYMQMQHGNSLRLAIANELLQLMIDIPYIIHGLLLTLHRLPNTIYNVCVLKKLHERRRAALINTFRAPLDLILVVSNLLMLLLPSPYFYLIGTGKTYFTYVFYRCYVLTPRLVNRYYVKLGYVLANKKGGKALLALCDVKSIAKDVDEHLPPGQEKRNNPLRVLGLIIINVIAVIIQSILLICIVVLPFFGWKREYLNVTIISISGYLLFSTVVFLLQDQYPSGKTKISNRINKIVSYYVICMLQCLNSLVDLFVFFPMATIVFFSIWRAKQFRIDFHAALMEEEVSFGQNKSRYAISKHFLNLCCDFPCK